MGVPFGFTESLLRRHQAALERSRLSAQRAVRDPEVMARCWAKLAEKRRQRRDQPEG